MAKRANWLWVIDGASNPRKISQLKAIAEGYVGASLMYVNYSVLIFSVRACAGICQTMLGSSKVFQRFYLEVRPSEGGSPKGTTLLSHTMRDMFIHGNFGGVSHDEFVPGLLFGPCRIPCRDASTHPQNGAWAEKWKHILSLQPGCERDMLRVL